MKKQWYEIKLKCIKENACIDCNVGDIQTIAKVRSLGLAYQVAMKLEEIYDSEHWKVMILV